MFYLFNNVLAARDNGGWIEAVIIAVIVGFSIIRAIYRSIKAASEQQTGRDESRQKPARPKKSYITGDESFKTLEQLREEKIVQIRAAFGIPQPPAEHKPVAAAAAARPAVRKTEKPIHRQPKIKKHLAPSQKQAAYAEPFNQARGRPKPPKVPAAADETIHKLLFSSPQDLRNAIIYQEILGKPLALRDT